MFRLLFRLLLLLVIIAILLAGLVIYEFFNKPLISNPPERSIIIKPGSSLHSIAQQLNKENLLNYPAVFVAWVQLMHREQSLRAGEYAIPVAMTTPQLLMNMVNGKVILHKITLVEGWTFKEFRQALNQDAYLEHQTQSLNEAEIMQALGAKYQEADGLFFPETYLFTHGDSDLSVLQMAYKKMQDSLAYQWKVRALELPYNTPYQAVIVASMIEKETAVPGDRAQISGVIMRRLQKGMRLQIDATVYYGQYGSQEAKLTKADLKKDGPYNTYMRSSLPPTPICMPSEESVYAALHPASGDSLYYVARGDGSSEFSATYMQHKAAIAEYLLKK